MAALSADSRDSCLVCKAGTIVEKACNECKVSVDSVHYIRLVKEEMARRRFLNHEKMMNNQFRNTPRVGDFTSVIQSYPELFKMLAIKSLEQELKQKLELACELCEIARDISGREEFFMNMFKTKLEKVLGLRVCNLFIDTIIEGRLWRNIPCPNLPGVAEDLMMWSVEDLCRKWEFPLSEANFNGYLSLDSKKSWQIEKEFYTDNFPDGDFPCQARKFLSQENRSRYFYVKDGHLIIVRVDFNDPATPFVIEPHAFDHLIPK